MANLRISNDETEVIVCCSKMQTCQPKGIKRRQRSNVDSFVGKRGKNNKAKPTIKTKTVNGTKYEETDNDGIGVIEYIAGYTFDKKEKVVYYLCKWKDVTLDLSDDSQYIREWGFMNPDLIVAYKKKHPKITQWEVGSLCLAFANKKTNYNKIIKKQK